MNLWTRRSKIRCYLRLGSLIPLKNLNPRLLGCWTHQLQTLHHPKSQGFRNMEFRGGYHLVGQHLVQMDSRAKAEKENHCEESHHDGGHRDESHRDKSHRDVRHHEESQLEGSQR